MVPHGRGETATARRWGSCCRERRPYPTRWRSSSVGGTLAITAAVARSLPTIVHSARRVRDGVQVGGEAGCRCRRTGRAEGEHGWLPHSQRRSGSDSGFMRRPSPRGGVEALRVPELPPALKRWRDYTPSSPRREYGSERRIGPRRPPAVRRGFRVAADGQPTRPPRQLSHGRRPRQRLTRKPLGPRTLRARAGRYCVLPPDPIGLLQMTSRRHAETGARARARRDRPGSRSEGWGSLGS